MTADIFHLPDRPDTFEGFLISEGLAPKTVHTYMLRINQAERFLNRMGATLETADVWTLRTLADNTANSHSMRGQLRAALKYFYRFCDRNDAPLKAIRVPSQPKMVNQALIPEDARKLAETARGWWPHGGIVLLGLYLGLRRAEIAGAQWQRFDKTMEWYTVTGKRDKTATIPVNPKLAAELAPHRQPSGWIFPGRKNVRAHISPNTVWTRTKQVAAEAGIGEIRTHQLRHTALTTALDNTPDLRAVMSFARHENPTVTAGYTRTTLTQLQAVAAGIVY